MKHVQRSLSMLLCLIFTIGLFPVSAGAATPEGGNLEISNAGFEQANEDGTPVDWANYNGNLNPVGTYTSSTERAYAGSASLKMTDPSSSAMMGVYSAGTLGVTEGYTYRASGMLYAEDASMIPQLYLKFYNMYGVEISNGSYVETMTGAAGQWNEITVQGIAPIGAVVARLMVYSSQSSTGTVYADAMALEQLPLLDPDGWTAEDGVQKSAPTYVFPGTEYMLSGYAFADNSTASVALNFYNAGGALVKRYCVSPVTTDVIRAWAPTTAATVEVEISDTNTGLVVLTPVFYGTQVPDGSFESMAESDTSAWTSNAGLTPVEVPNGDFEQVSTTASSWASYDGGAFELSTTEKYEGNSAYKVSGSGNGVRSALIDVTPGTTYVLKAKYKTSSEIMRAYLMYWDENGVVGNPVDSAFVDLPATDSWADTPELSLEAPDGAQYVTVLFYFLGGYSGGEGYVDNVQLTKFVDVVNVVADGDFEDASGAAPNWFAYDSGSYAITTDEQYAGAASCKVMGSGGGVRSALIEVTPGVAYSLTAKYKTSSEIMRAYIMYWDENGVVGDPVHSAFVDLPATDSWTDTPELVLAAPEGAQYVTVLFYFLGGYSENEGYVDQVCLNTLFEMVHVPDGDFELVSGGDADWASYDGGAFELSTTEKYEGNSSYKVSGSGGGVRSALIEVTPGLVYSMTAKYKTSSDVMRAYLMYWDENGVVGDPISSAFVDLPASDQWADTPELSLTAPAGAQYVTVLFYFLSGYSGEGYVDSVTLAESDGITTFASLVSTEFVTDGEAGIVLTDDRTTSGWIPVLSGKDYAAVVDVKGDATMKLTYYDQTGVVLEKQEVSSSGTEPQKLTIVAQTPMKCFGAKITLEADGTAYFDHVQVCAVTDSISNVSFEDVPHSFAGKHAYHWQSFGDVLAQTYGSLQLPDGALALQVTGCGGEGGVRSSMIRIESGTTYTARAHVDGDAQLRVAYFDAAFNRLTSCANAAYAALEFVVEDGETAILDDVECTPAVIDVQDHAQLFIDDYLIESTTLERVFHQGEKGQTIVAPNETNPWEKDGAYIYGTVLYDAQEKIYKMWYQTFNESKESGGDAASVMACYATSVDGVHWDYPNLGIVNYEGNTNNNIIGNYHIMSVFIDDEAPANERYKMFTFLHDWTNNTYGYMCSADGIHWTERGAQVAGADVANAAWDQTNGQYYAVIKNGTTGKRDQWTVTADAMDNWGTPVMANSLGDLIDMQRCYRPDSYGQGLYERDGVYIGLNWMFYIPGYIDNEGLIEPQLTFSRDLKEEWQRPTRMPIIPLGEAGSIDDGMIFTTAYAIEVGDEVWVYTGVWDGDHAEGGRDCQIYITKWRMDGFASMEGTGALITKPVTFDGNVLCLNADAADGTIRVELLGSDGAVLEGYSKDDCDAITTDSVEHIVSWRGNSDLSSLQDTGIQVKIYADDAAVYSLTFGQRDITPKPATPNATFTANGPMHGVLTDVDDTMQYSLDGGATWNAITDSSVALTGVTVDSGIQIKAVQDGKDSDIQIIRVTKAETPAAPVLCQISDSSVLIQSVAGQLYSIDGGRNWVEAEEETLTFYGLKSNRTYSIVTKVPASGTQLESGISAGLHISTDRSVYMLVAQMPAGGTITANGRSLARPQSFVEGTQVALTFQPPDGYVIQDIIVNGRSVGAVEEYVIQAVFRYTTVQMVCRAQDEEPYVFPFTDVREDDWFYEAVRHAHQLGLIDGMTDTTYLPDGEMTLAQALTLAARMYASTTGDTLSNGEETWYSPYVDYCLEKGIIDERPTTAALNAAVTRAEYAGIFAKALPPELLPEINHIPDSSIPDVKMDDENAQAIYLLYRAGIVDGRDDYGRFDPNERIERAEIATILVRMMDPSARVGRPPLLGQ